MSPAIGRDRRGVNRWQRSRSPRRGGAPPPRRRRRRAFLKRRLLFGYRRLGVARPPDLDRPADRAQGLPAALFGDAAPEFDRHESRHLLRSPNPAVVRRLPQPFPERREQRRGQHPSAARRCPAAGRRGSTARRRCNAPEAARPSAARSSSASPPRDRFAPATAARSPGSAAPAWRLHSLGTRPATHPDRDVRQPAPCLPPLLVTGTVTPSNRQGNPPTSESIARSPYQTRKSRVVWAFLQLASIRLMPRKLCNPA